MKDTLMTAGIVLGTLIGIPFLLYSLLGFFFWLFTDPLNIMPEPPKYPTVLDAGTVACQERGGIPVRSEWNGMLKDCLLTNSSVDKSRPQ